MKRMLASMGAFFYILCISTSIEAGDGCLTPTTFKNTSRESSSFEDGAVLKSHCGRRGRRGKRGFRGKRGRRGPQGSSGGSGSGVYAYAEKIIGENNESIPNPMRFPDGNISKGVAIDENNMTFTIETAGDYSVDYFLHGQVAEITDSPGPTQPTYDPCINIHVYKAAGGTVTYSSDMYLSQMPSHFGEGVTYRFTGVRHKNIEGLEVDDRIMFFTAGPNLKFYKNSTTPSPSSASVVASVAIQLIRPSGS